MNQVELLLWLLAAGISPFVAVSIVRWWSGERKLSKREEEYAINEIERAINEYEES